MVRITQYILQTIPKTADQFWWSSGIEYHLPCGCPGLDSSLGHQYHDVLFTLFNLVNNFQVSFNMRGWGGVGDEGIETRSLKF